ncbi:copper resistance protein CopC [Actinoplanes sp. ATCC 53533]|nr:copper resistance protein CopC [Actinoplanes sp. ATCC 53533]
MRALVLTAVGLGVTVLPAVPASAHAGLVSSTPEAGSVLGQSPEQITLTFNETVSAVPGRIQVVAPDGKRITESVAVRGNVLTIRVRRADQALGTYLVSYRMVSGDSHPIGNALIFSVGAPSARPAEADPSKVHPTVTAAVSTFKFLGYAGLTLIVGPTLFLALLWPRRMSRRGPIRLVRAGLALTVVATMGTLWSQAPYGSGAPLWDVSLPELSDVLASRFGITLTARLAVLALIAGLITPVLRGTSGWVRTIPLLGLGAAGLTTWPLTGHAVVSPLAGALVAADVVHMAAMAVWLGGLVTLSAFLLRRANSRVLRVILPVWSRWATLAVVWLVSAGVVQSVVQVGSVPALWQTGYGQLLLAKVAVLATVLATAAFARKLVQRHQVSSQGPAQLRRTVGVEIAATTAILAMSAVLVQVTPGRSAETRKTPPVEDGVSQTLTSKLYTLQFNIYPVELGEWNTVHGQTYTPEGKPLPAKEWTVTTRHVGQDLEPVTEPIAPLPARNDALGSLTFPLPGTYEITFTIRTTELDQATVKTTVTVPATPQK